MLVLIAIIGAIFNWSNLSFIKLKTPPLPLKKSPHPTRQNRVPRVAQSMSDPSTIILAFVVDIEDMLTMELVEILATGLVCPARLSFRSLWL